MSPSRFNVGRGVIVAGCTYEICAIVSGKAPTITHIIQTVGRKRGARVFMWMWLGFVVDHFLDD